MVFPGALHYTLSKYNKIKEEDDMEAHVSNKQALEYSVKNTKLILTETIKNYNLSCLKTKTVSIDDDDQIDEIDEKTELKLRAWRRRRERYVSQARDSISSFRQKLMSESRVSSIDMDFWRVLASQNDRVTMMIVMFVVKCRFSRETSKAMDLFQNWKQYGGDC